MTDLDAKVAQVLAVRDELGDLLMESLADVPDAEITVTIQMVLAALVGTIASALVSDANAEGFINTVAHRAHHVLDARRRGRRKPRKPGGEVH